MQNSQFIRIGTMIFNVDKIMLLKYQCALDNEIIILYSKDYQKYIDWFYKNGYKKEDFIV